MASFYLCGAFFVRNYLKATWVMVVRLVLMDVLTNAAVVHTDCVGIMKVLIKPMVMQSSFIALNTAKSRFPELNFIWMSAHSFNRKLQTVV